ncbi:MAG: recombination-associated protein RdgC [Deltaproteobacteria bacterium]|nr:recombination-associated protein RdgC [Deltaproteobacteria bacterium]
MGALKGAVTVRRYLVRGEAPREKSRLIKGARAHVHVVIDPKGEIERSHGWATVEDPHDLDLSSDKMFFGDALAACLRIDTLRPPSAIVRRMVDERLSALGRKPSKSEKDACKKEVVRKLRGQAFPVTRSYDMTWQLDTGRVLFFSHSKGPNELMIDLFKKSFGLELVPCGPGQVAKEHGLLSPTLAPTPEMIIGFPGFPGRSTTTEDSDA